MSVYRFAAGTASQASAVSLRERGEYLAVPLVNRNLANHPRCTPLLGFVSAQFACPALRIDLPLLIVWHAEASR